MDKLQIIANMPLFKGLKAGDVEKLGRITTEKVFMPGSQIFSEGSKGDCLYAIKSGTVRIVKHSHEGEEEITRMGPGEHFGEMAVIDGLAHSASVETLEHTEMICITRADLINLLSNDDALGYRVYKAFSGYLCARLRQTSNDLIFMRSLAKRRSADD